MPGPQCPQTRPSRKINARSGNALASRALNAYLRSLGLPGSGSAPFSARDRSRFASALDAAVGKLARARL